MPIVSNNLQKLHYINRFLCRPKGLTLKNSMFSPHCVFITFRLAHRRKSDYFPIRHQVTGFITQMECVYCEVRVEVLNILQVTCLI